MNQKGRSYEDPERRPEKNQDRPDSRSGEGKNEMTPTAQGDREEGRRARSKRREWLGRSLKELYNDTVDEPLPDGFRQLLDELERKEKTRRE